MDLESLMDAANVYSTGVDNTWSFIFTMIFAAVGFLATLRQVFSEDHRSQQRYKVLVRVVQIGMVVFVVNDIVALRELFLRLNTVMRTIQEKAEAASESPELVRAFKPYVADAPWLAEACQASIGFDCAHNMPISLLVFIPASFIVILLMPMIAGFHKATKSA